MKLERISLAFRDGSVRAFDFDPGLTVIEGDPGAAGPSSSARGPPGQDSRPRPSGPHEPGQRLERRLIVTADDLLEGDPTGHSVRRLARFDPGAACSGPRWRR